MAKLFSLFRFAREPGLAITLQIQFWAASLIAFDCETIINGTITLMGVAAGLLVTFSDNNLQHE